LGETDLDLGVTMSSSTRNPFGCGKCLDPQNSDHDSTPRLASESHDGLGLDSSALGGWKDVQAFCQSSVGHIPRCTSGAWSVHENGRFIQHINFQAIVRCGFNDDF